LAQHSVAGWQVIASGGSGREPPSLLAGLDSELYIVAWPGGEPRISTIAATATGWQVSSSRVPGDWTHSDWPYGTAAISASGDITVVESDQVGHGLQVRGDMRVATRLAATGAWTWSVTPSQYRYAYPWVSPDDAGHVALVATRDVLWNRLGYTRPEGSFRYVYDAIRVWHEDRYDAPTLEPGALVRRVRPTRRYPNITATAAQPAVYRDSRQLLHVLYYLRGPSTKGALRLRHAVIRGDTVVKDVGLPVGLTYAKLVEDGRGELYLLGIRDATQLYVYPTTSKNGTTLGEPSIHALHDQPVRYAGLTSADPRSGTARSDSVDLVYPSGRDEQRWVYLRLRLR
jgi:hypothetical protein